MEIIKDVTIYQCSYCGKKMIRRSSVVRHEKLCPYNHGCKTCKFYEECEPETIYDPFHGGNPGSTDYDVPVWWCNARDERIYKYVALCNLWETLSTKTSVICNECDKVIKEFDIDDPAAEAGVRH